MQRHLATRGTPAYKGKAKFYGSLTILAEMPADKKKQANKFAYTGL